MDSENANGINLWCYCNNNPVMGVDYDGNIYEGYFLDNKAEGYGIFNDFVSVTDAKISQLYKKKTKSPWYNAQTFCL